MTGYTTKSNRVKIIRMNTKSAPIYFVQMYAPTSAANDEILNIFRIPTIVGLGGLYTVRISVIIQVYKADDF